MAEWEVVISSVLWTIPGVERKRLEFKHIKSRHGKIHLQPGLQNSCTSVKNMFLLRTKFSRIYFLAFPTAFPGHIEARWTVYMLPDAFLITLRCLSSSALTPSFWHLSQTERALIAGLKRETLGKEEQKEPFAGLAILRTGLASLSCLWVCKPRERVRLPQQYTHKTLNSIHGFRCYKGLLTPWANASLHTQGNWNHISNDHKATTWHISYGHGLHYFLLNSVTLFWNLPGVKNKKWGTDWIAGRKRSGVFCSLSSTNLNWALL